MLARTRVIIAGSSAQDAVCSFATADRSPIAPTAPIATAANAATATALASATTRRARAVLLDAATLEE
jgi:hypothetical protein